MHLVLLLLVQPDKSQQCLVLPELFGLSALSLPLPTLAERGRPSGWHILHAYVTASLQFLTRSVELGAHLFGARDRRLCTVSCESWEPVANTFNHKRPPTINECANCNCEPTASTKYVVDNTYCMLSSNLNRHLN